jgi:hypothetical protein
LPKAKDERRKKGQRPKANQAKGKGKKEGVLLELLEQGRQEARGARDEGGKEQGASHQWCHQQGATRSNRSKEQGASKEQVEQGARAASKGGEQGAFRTSEGE